MQQKFCSSHYHFAFHNKNLAEKLSDFDEILTSKSGIRILRGPLRTADLRGPASFYLFLKIRILRKPLMRGPYLNSFLFVIHSFLDNFQNFTCPRYNMQKHKKLSNWFLNSEDILHVFDFTKILFQIQSMISDCLN